MKLLVLDTETNSTDAKTCDLIELGAVLYDTCTKTVISAVGVLNPNSKNSEEAEAINHISDSIISATPKNMYRYGVELFRTMWNASDFIVAHNIDFDKELIERFKLQGRTDKHWICTYKHIIFESKEGGKTLKNLLFEADVKFEKKKLHRAMYDSDYLVDLLKTQDDIEEQIDDLVLNIGKKTCYSAIRPLNMEFKEANKIFKDNLFTFNWDTKKWERYMSEEQKKTLPFQVEEIPGTTFDLPKTIGLKMKK